MKSREPMCSHQDLEPSGSPFPSTCYSNATMSSKVAVLAVPESLHPQSLEELGDYQIREGREERPKDLRHRGLHQTRTS